MVFSQALLWQKGPVANIWTAAYCLKKLKREQIAQTDIASSVDHITLNKDEISYRILAHLLVGLVKIFSKKVEFLEQDCNVTLRTLTESFQAIYSKKSKHGGKRTSDVPESSSAAASGACNGSDLLETLRAQCDRVVVSVPASFELDLFDLEITDDCDAPDRHQLSAHNADKMSDESNNFFQKTYIKGSGCQFFFSTSFTTIEDVIPAEMMTDIDLDITDLYALDSDKRESALNPNTEDPIIDNTLNPNNADALLTEQHEESIQNLYTEDPIVEDDAVVEPSIGCCEPLLRDVNPDLNASADQWQESTHNLNAEGLYSPRPMVRTPARKDTLRNLRKRKVSSYCEKDNLRILRKRKVSSYCDHEIVLSNEVMRNAINDPSDLVYEKRKKPRTYLEAWRRERFSSVDQLFTDPLIPCTFATVHTKTSNHTPHTPNNNCNTEPEKPPPTTPHENSTYITNVRVFPDLKQSITQLTHRTGSGEQLSETVTKSEKVRRCLFEPGTPESGPRRRSTDLSDDWGNERNEDSYGFGFGGVLDGHTSDDALSSLDSDLGCHDGDGDVEQINGDTVWSVRTRYVAHHLHKKISKLKRRNQESVLSLEQMLQGKKRKTCARFFYETLMLKGRGMIDVKQEFPYADIKISATPLLFEELGDGLGAEQKRRKKMCRE